jgi:membrane protease YdiL (CAAX protease family)
MRESERIPIRFFLITFSWAWILWLPLVLCGFGIIPLSKDMLSVLSIPAIGLGAFGPAVGAFCSLRTTKGKGAIRTYLKSFLSLKFGWKAWIAIFIVFGLSTAAAWIIPECFSEPRVSMLLPSILIFPLYWLLMVFVGGGQEEIGWRGYILPLLENKFGRWLGSGILGLIWASWHLPLWFIPGATQTYMNFGGFIMLMLGYSFLFSWVREASGKRPLAGMIVHGTANAFVPLFPVVVLNVNAVQVRYWIWVSLTLAIGIIFLWAQTARASASGKGEAP